MLHQQLGDLKDVGSNFRDHEEAGEGKQQPLPLLIIISSRRDSHDHFPDSLKRLRKLLHKSDLPPPPSSSASSFLLLLLLLSFSSSSSVTCFLPAEEVELIANM